MATTSSIRDEVYRRLSALSATDVLDLLQDEIILQLAASFSPAPPVKTERFPTSSPETALAGEILPSAPALKAKRPLNSFIAFRTYYNKCFGGMQQKLASGFLTKLWQNDQFRNRWILIAKVFSFVRDEIGRDKVSLAPFLAYACPIMNIIDPPSYLNACSFTLGTDESGLQTLRKTPQVAGALKAQSRSTVFPNTENELLAEMVRAGYLPHDADDLMQRSYANMSGSITTSSPAPALWPPEKVEFIHAIRSDRYEATKDILGGMYLPQVVASLGVKSHHVEDINVIEQMQKVSTAPDPASFYQWSPSGILLEQNDDSLFQFSRMDSTRDYDMNNSLFVDSMLGMGVQEGERAVGLQMVPGYDSWQGF